MNVTLKIWPLLFIVLAPLANANECVILLHGLARSSSSMKPIETHLSALNYQVINVDYPSTKHSIEELAESVVPAAIAQCPTSNTIHVVSHSMGGIILRYYLQHNAIPKLGHVVMLGPPNQGSEVVDSLQELPLFTWLNGPAGLQLGTSNAGFISRLPAVDFHLGVIAGNRSVNPLLSQLIPAEDDGKVSVKRSRVEGMTDHLVLPVSHTFMMRDQNVIKQLSHFLKNGRFIQNQAF